MTRLHLIGLLAYGEALGLLAHYTCGAPAWAALGAPAALAVLTAVVMGPPQ